MGYLMSPVKKQSKRRSGKRLNIEHRPVVQIKNLEVPGEPLSALIEGIEFCRLYYDHNRLLVAVNQYLKTKTNIQAEETAVLMEGRANTPSNRSSAADQATELLQHHAAGVTMYISHNLHFMFGSMLEAYLNVGGLHAKQDKELQLGLDPEPITAEKIQRIFADLAMQYVQRQANATGGRRPDIAKEKAKRDLERAVTELRQERRKITIEEAEDVLGLGTGTLKGIIRRHHLNSYWRELKKGVET